MKKTYYTLPSRWLPGWRVPLGVPRIEDGTIKGHLSAQFADADRWGVPPHVALVNLGYDPALGSGFASDSEIVRYVRQYGDLGVHMFQRPGGRRVEPLSEAALDYLPEEMHDGAFDAYEGRSRDALELSPAEFHEAQVRARAAWQKGDYKLFGDPKNYVKMLNIPGLGVNWEIVEGVLEVRVPTWFDYVAILLARDIAEKRARFCRNPKCDAPFFVERRQDAKYCSHRCASDASVDMFRERQRRKDANKKRILAKKQK